MRHLRALEIERGRGTRRESWEGLKRGGGPKEANESIGSSTELLLRK